MKKVKVTLRVGSPGRKFYLFPTAEALYVWLCAMERNEQVQVPGIEELLLEPGGYMEVELRGFEYSYEGGQKFKRLNLIRLGKAQQPKNASGVLVTIHTGWVSGGLLPLRAYTDNDIDVKVMDPKDAKLDLPVLFKDEPAPADEDESIDVEVDDDDDEKK